MDRLDKFSFIALAVLMIVFIIITNYYAIFPH